MAVRVREKTKRVGLPARQAGERVKAGFEAAYAELNEQQRKAVDAIEGPVMVLAGPGTGKTQVLALRVANILRLTQMDPWNILCLTFTESGVVAMRERLVEMMGPAAYQVRVHTFHGFCNDVIQEFPEKFAESTRWDVLSEVERVEIFRDIIDGLDGKSNLKPFGNPYMFLKDIAGNIQRLKQEDISPDALSDHLVLIEKFLKAVSPTLRSFFTLKPKARTENECDAVREVMLAESEKMGMNQSWIGFVTSLFDPAFAEASAGKAAQSQARTKIKNNIKRWFESCQRQLPRQRELIGIYEKYQAELRARGRYDYDDMIVSVVSRMKSDDELLAHYQEQFQYMLVDEYQDTNTAQNEAIQLLGSFMEKPNVFVVGDDKQSIFRFQGASLENLRFFYDLYRDDVTVISLKENYRSQQTIIDAAQSVIANNTESIEKYIDVEIDLRSANGLQAQRVEAREYVDEEAEHFGVARRIKELIDGGVPAEEIAVLYRYNRDVSGILGALRSLEIPARVEAGENVLDDVHIHQLIQLLKYLDSQREETLAEVLQYQFWGFEALDVIEIIHDPEPRRVQGRSGIFKRMTKSEVFKGTAKKLAQWRVAAENYTLQQLVDIVLNESGYLSWLLEQPGHVTAVGKLNRLLNELKRLNRANPRLKLGEFVRELTILRENGIELTFNPSTSSGQARRVRLMTAHKAKGLEFEHVFIIHAADKQWGNAGSRDRVPLPHGLLKYDLVAGNFNNEDDRRLFYVAMTRAKQGLHLSYAQHNGHGRAQVPSVFWRELPADLVDQQAVGEDEELIEKKLKAQAEHPVAIASDDDVRTWLRERLKAYVMSVTHLNNYLECPRLFYYRNVLRVPAAKTKHMAFGTAVHNALRDLFAEHAESKKLPAEKYLIDQFKFHLEREVLTDTEESDSLSLGKDVLKKYYKQYRGEWLPETMVEYDFRSHGVEVGGVRLTGKLDKVEVLDAKAKTVNVVDYKTGNPDSAGANLKKDGNYYRQLVFYKLLCELSPQFQYEMVSGEVDFIQPSKRTGKLVKKKFEISLDELEELRTTVARVWNEIQELRFLEPEAACGECEYCVTC